jgi:two-component sensor histidine kinase
VALEFGLRFVTAADPYDHPFIFFIPAILLAAILFDRGAGIYAVFLSALIAIYGFIAPATSSAVAAADDLAAAIVFVAVGLVTAVLIESLHTAFSDLHQAHSELGQSRKQLDEALQARDILLAEVSHRIKNDMATLATTLTMQARDSRAEETQTALRAAADRLQVLSRVHSKLRASAMDVDVDAKAFIEDLCDDLGRSLVAMRPISVEVSAESHRLSLNRAVPLGLIINELLTNALKYAFPADREGRIKILFERKDDDFHLCVCDNGVGFPGERAEGLGTRLVRALSAQLGGRLRIEGGAPGTECKLVFPCTDGRFASAHE